MLPSDGRQVRQRFIVNSDAVRSQRGDGSFQVHGVPEGDGADYQVQTTSAIPLALKAAVAEAGWSRAFTPR